MIWSRLRVGYLQAGNMFYQRKPSGSMPAGQERPRIYSWGNDINFHAGEFQVTFRMEEERAGNDLQQTTDMRASMRPTPGAFLTCREMCGNGSATGRRTILPVPRPIPRVRHRARIGSYGVVPGAPAGRTCVRLSAATTPPVPQQPIGFRVGFQPVQPDTANPELELFGGAGITREAGQAWAEPGAAGHDARDGNLTASISVSGTVDMNTTGTYILTYSVADAAGNTATANRTVTVVGNRSVDLNATVAMDMLWVPAGTFTMGSPTTEAGRQSDREDEHNVSLTKGFYLGKYEVTQAQYEAVMTGNTDGLNATPSQWPNNPNRPVEKVSWADAQIFLTRLNAQQSANIPAGWAYVLPTESQWEYACRAGTTTAYSWGATIASSNANYNWDGGAMTETILNKLAMWGNMRPTHGAFLICTEMCGNGPRTGTRRPIPLATRWSIRPDRHRARFGSHGVVPGATSGRACVLLSATPSPPATVTATSASVLVSNSSSKRREEA